MKRLTGSPRLHLASSITQKTMVANSEKQLHSVLAKLGECRAALIGSNREAAQLVSVAILQLRMKLNRIADVELKALCDAMMPDATPAKSHSQKSPLAQGPGPRRRPPALLKLVK